MSAVLAPAGASARWTPLRYNETQQAYWCSRHRFNTLPCGRRSGKTELFKRKLVKRGISATTPWQPRFFAGAPTRDQAKRIFWDDLKALTEGLRRRPPSETELLIELINGAQLFVVGLDKPERIEGSPWDGGGLDEFANMKPTAWKANVRPALSDRMGWCDLFGVPEGRNHYYELDRYAKAQMKEHGERSEWASFHWKSSEILPASEIEAAMRDLDALTFDQEYNASFVNFTGRAYYPFNEEEHCAPLKYDPRAPLILCFDFNVEPGVCAIIQEQFLPGKYQMIKSQGGVLVKQQVLGTAVIAEVHIPYNSSTPAVCRKVVKDFGKHQGFVRCYGDATGGARGSAKVEGSDWDLIEAELTPVFGTRLSLRYKDANPKERARVNAVNTRMKSANGTVKLMVDSAKAPNVQKDFEGVVLLEGGSGEIDKKKDETLTHVSDAVGYYIEYEFPVISQAASLTSLGGA